MSFFNIKKEKIVAILDVGSSSVGGAIVSFNDSDVPKILFSVREEMVFQHALNMKRFVASMITTLEKVLDKLDKAKVGNPDEFVCALASPWYEGVTKTVKIQEKDSFIVTSNMIDELVKKEIDASRASIDSNKKNEEATTVIDMQNIQIKLNGYETSSPDNKKANVLEVSFFFALGFDKTLLTIRNSISKVANSKNVVFHAFPLMSFVVIRDIFTDKNNFLFLDITGEVTDISLVKDNVLVGIRSFPFGKNFVIRRMSSRLNTPPEEAISLFGLVHSKKSDNKIKERLDEILADTRKEWVDAFSTVALDVIKGHPVPNTVFFTADDEIAEYFSKTLETDKFEELSLLNETFDVRFLNAKTLENFCNFKDIDNEEKVHRDPFIIIESIFIHRNKS